MERECYERHLPHWYPSGATLFLTMRLAGSLPQPLVAQIRADFHRAQELAGDDETALVEVRRQYFGRFDGFLDAGLPESPRWLAEPNVAALMLESLHWVAKRGDFEPLAVCVMPNHLHAVVTLPSELIRPFEQTLRDFKQYTALHANQLLHRAGPFWQSETYDHVIRDPGDGTGLARVIQYVLHNPVKARLCADWLMWPGTWCTPLAM